MIKKFKHKGLKDFFETGNKKGIQASHAKRLRLILIRLHSSQTVEDMDLPGFKLHSLKGNFQSHYAVTVSGNWRIIFKFDGNDSVGVDYIDYH
jgi:proteic killer suppression protein